MKLRRSGGIESSARVEMVRDVFIASLIILLVICAFVFAALVI